MSVVLSDEDLLATVRTLNETGSQVKAALSLGISRAALQGRLKRAAERGLMGYDPVLAGFAIKSVASQKHGAWIKQTKAPGEPFEMPSGQVLKEVSALVDGDKRVVMEWIKTKAGNGPTIIDAVKELFADNQNIAPLIPAPSSGDDDLMTLYPLPDLHVGMHAWGRETGESYDLKIASTRARQMAADLISQSRPSRQAVILGLGDLFHMNDQRNMTPRSGHILDVDGRWPKVLKAGVRLAMDIVEMAAQKHERVLVRFLPGNHDPDATAALSVALGLHYEGNDRVTFDDDPSLVFYHRFGRVLIGATHGHTMKPDRMAMMLAADRPEDWGATAFKHVYFGHIHHETAIEIGPVRVESFNTIAAKDAHAHGGGWRSGQALNAITFHRERGEIGRHRVALRPDHNLAA